MDGWMDGWNHQECHSWRLELLQVEGKMLLAGKQAFDEGDVRHGSIGLYTTRHGHLGYKRARRTFERSCNGEQALFFSVFFSGSAATPEIF
jgi:hypothetical protein